MFVDTANPLNEGVLRYLGRVGKPVSPVVASSGSVPDLYMCQGSHPDIVERVWDGLGAGLPRKCRCLVHGTPSIVHNRSGVVIAICNGTQYNLRLTPADFSTALAAGAKTRTRWSDGTEMDSLAVLGTDWVFGGWFADEPKWIANTYSFHGPPCGQA